LSNETRQHKLERTKRSGKFVARRYKKFGTLLPPAEKVNTYNLTEEEAEAALLDLLSPAHLNLMIVRHLQRIIEDGGNAGADAAKMLRDMQKELCPNSRKTTLVTFQPQSREGVA
jgi:hypothetical protein